MPWRLAEPARRLVELEREVLRLLEENRSLTRELALHEAFRFDPFERGTRAGAAMEVAAPARHVPSGKPPVPPARRAEPVATARFTAMLKAAARI